MFDFFKKIEKKREEPLHPDFKIKMILVVEFTGFERIKEKGRFENL
jgi:hypothetical protein